MVRDDRRHRLTGRGAFETVFRQGRRSDGEYLQLVSTSAASGCGRSGLVIGRKQLPRAVDRNRIRRMLRVALVRARPCIGAHDVVVRLKRAAPRDAFRAIVAEAERMLEALGSCTGAA